MNQYRIGLLAALALSSSLAFAADTDTPANRQGRMNDAYTTYRNTQPGGVDRSGTSVRRDGGRAERAVGNAARRTGHAVANGARKTGHAVANGARRTGHAVGTGLRKSGEAMDRGGATLQEKSVPKP